jgi:DNA-binding transcriptional LysR family regulator
LERELGVVLVDRQRGGLTDEGVIVVDRARRSWHELEDLAAEMASRGNEVTGDSHSVDRHDRPLAAPAALAQVSRAHPGVHVTIHEGNTSSLLPRLQSSQIDAAIPAPADR